jgi:hypothetical protein
MNASFERVPSLKTKVKKIIHISKNKSKENNPQSP